MIVSNQKYTSSYTNASALSIVSSQAYRIFVLHLLSDLRATSCVFLEIAVLCFFLLFSCSHLKELPLTLFQNAGLHQDMASGGPGGSSGLLCMLMFAFESVLDRI